MLWPNGSTTKPYVSSAFGPRNIPVPNASKNHKGTDFSRTFTIIRAVAAGQVKVAGTPDGWSGGGLQVWVQHDGFFSKSLHSAQLLVRAGQFVREGDPLAIMGKTGTASDVHLHFEITLGAVHYSNSGQIDPVPFLADRIGGAPAGGSGTTPEEDDMPTIDELMNHRITVRGGRASITLEEAFQRTFDVYDAIFVGGTSMPDNGRPIKDSIDGIVQVVDRIDSRVVSLKPGQPVDLSALSDADVQRIAKASADEQAKRLTPSTSH